MQLASLTRHAQCFRREVRHPSRPRSVLGRRAFESRAGVTANASTERQSVDAFLFARLPARPQVLRELAGRFGRSSPRRASRQSMTRRHRPPPRAARRCSRRHVIDSYCKCDFPDSRDHAYRAWPRKRSCAPKMGSLHIQMLPHCIYISIAITSRRTPDDFVRARCYPESPPRRVSSDLQKFGLAGEKSHRDGRMARSSGIVRASCSSARSSRPAVPHRNLVVTE